jgi:hypothetical protein
VARRSFAMGAQMKIQKLVAVVAIVGLASSTASIAPVSAHGYHWASPWPAVTVMVGVVGVMTNAAYVWRTQCRELSSKEAITSTFLPFVGMAFDAQASKCR